MKILRLKEIIKEEIVNLLEFDLGPGWVGVGSGNIKSKNAVSDLENALKNHHWMYKMSDDHSRYTKGKIERDNIYRLLSQVDCKVAKKLWYKHLPRHPEAKKMFEFPKNRCKK